MPTTVEQLRLDFFELIFGDEDGKLCIATIHKDRGKTSFKRFFFDWPKQSNELIGFISSKEKAHNVYFSTALFKLSKAEKAFACPTKIVWADLDTCKPEDVTPSPPIVLETSPGRYHALWTLQGYVEPEIAEQYAHALAYQYAPEGADKSGWDIGQLLRVPLTSNFKKEYQATGGEYPSVRIERMLDLPVPDEVFESIPKPESRNGNTGVVDVGMPDLDSLESAKTIIERHAARIESMHVFLELFETEPDTSDDWSKRLWRLTHLCYEAGMLDKQVFAVVRESACNKYARDGRPDRYLWLEVLKAGDRHRVIADIETAATDIHMPIIYDPDEAEDQFTFIDMYREWGVNSTDAPPQFHDLSAVMVLSALLSANVVLPVSFGEITPNLWGLVLGESTLSRKTTTTRMAMEVIANIDKDLMLTSDGSIEGIMTAMSHRSHKVSIFFRDEISGFFESISKRDYLAGMQEAFTQLYDVPPMWRRTLRKETITVESPSFMFFAGGIKERVYLALQEQAITSGFLPRFLIVYGESNIEDVQPIGPPAVLKPDEYSRPVMQHAHHMYNTYNRSQTIKLTGGDKEQTIEQPLRVKAQLTDDAWSRMQRIERQLLIAGNNSALSHMMLPTFQRLSTSMLKLAVLIGASRQEPSAENTIVIEDRDVRSASKYIQLWGDYNIDAVLNIGKGVSERILMRVLNTIRRKESQPRSIVMRDNHLTRKQMDDIVGTLIDRGHIVVEKVGRTEVYVAVD